MAGTPPSNMAVDGESTERTTVQTYIPAYQKDQWREHADRLDMSLSEFVRTMVQAGRRGFLTAPDDPENGREPPPLAESWDGEADNAEEFVLEALAEHEYLSWEELIEAIVGDVEARIGGALDQLQNENRVQYSGPDGGYTRVDE